MHIAIFCKRDLESNNITERRAFTGGTRLDAVRLALAARDEAQRGGRYGPYKVFVGELTHEVVSPVIEFTEVPLRRGE